MNFFSPRRCFLLPALIVTTLAGCATTGASESGESSKIAPGSKPVLVATASAPASPCDWISPADVEAQVGPLAGSPRIVRSFEDPTPQKDGRACLYPLALKPQTGAGAVIVEVSLNSGVLIETASGMMKERFAREMGEPTSAPDQEPAPDGWDYQGVPLPMTYFGRVGHISVSVASRTVEVPSDRLAGLAARVRDRIPDGPFQEPVDPMLAELNAALGERIPTSAAPGPDPCSLLTRAEAEAVLGKLTAAPYKSAESSPLANPEGPSCTYLTEKHRALVITPTWSDGKMLFGMAKGVGGIIASVFPQESASTLKGPWDQATISGTTGTLYFLKGNRMLALDYRTSSTNRSGALKLAALAVPRL